MHPSNRIPPIAGVAETFNEFTPLDLTSPPGLAAPVTVQHLLRPVAVLDDETCADESPAVDALAGYTAEQGRRGLGRLMADLEGGQPIEGDGFDDLRQPG